MNDQVIASELSPNVIAPPDTVHALEKRAFQGIASLALSPRAMWATWYAGPTPNEDENNYAVLSRSDDGGQTWREEAVVDPDGAGPVRAFDPQVWVDPLGRLCSHLTAFLSRDDGKSWRGGLLLDERAKVSYPDGQQAADGTIFITYDFERTGAREINWVCFREEDILSGDAASPTVSLRRRISSAI